MHGGVPARNQAVRKKAVFLFSLQRAVGWAFEIWKQLCVGALSSAGHSDCKSSIVDGLPLCSSAMSDLGNFGL